MFGKKKTDDVQDDVQTDEQTNVLEPYPKETVEHILKRKMDELDLVTGDVAEYTNKKFLENDEKISLTAEDVGMLLNDTDSDDRLTYVRQYIPEQLKLSDVEIEKWLNRNLRGYPYIPDEVLPRLKKCVEHQMLPLKKDRDAFVDERSLRQIMVDSLLEIAPIPAGFPNFNWIKERTGVDSWDFDHFGGYSMNGKMYKEHFALNEQTLYIGKILEFDDKEFEKWILINLDFMDVPKRFYGNFIRCIERKMNEVGIEEGD